MRVDVFLHRVCLLRSRTLAREACDRGKVSLNGVPAKGSHEVHAGDRLRCDLGIRVLDLDVLEVPAGPVSRKEARNYYRLLSEERSEL